MGPHVSWCGADEVSGTAVLVEGSLPEFGCGSDVRVEKVMALREAIAAGAYRVPAAVIAERLVAQVAEPKVGVARAERLVQ